MHRMTVNSSEHLCGGLNAKSAPDKWLRAPTGSGSVGPKYAERSKNTKKLRRVGYWCLERTHAHQRDRDQTPRSADVICAQSVLIAYQPDFHMFGRTQSHTIAWPSKSYIYYFFLLIGSSAPVPATYARMMDPERSGFRHR